METYQNVNGNSGIAGYKIGDTCIEVEFADTESVYRYFYESAGRENVEEMKRLAAQGHGLNSFINRRVKYLYEKRESLVLKGSLFCIAV